MTEETGTKQLRRICLVILLHQVLHLNKRRKMITIEGNEDKPQERQFSLSNGESESLDDVSKRSGVDGKSRWTYYSLGIGQGINVAIDTFG